LRDWDNFKSHGKWFELINAEIRKYSCENKQINFKKQSEFNMHLINILQNIKGLNFDKNIIENCIEKIKELYEIDEVVLSDLLEFLNA
jgi:hypothetical protein